MARAQRAMIDIFLGAGVLVRGTVLFGKDET